MYFSLDYMPLDPFKIHTLSLRKKQQVCSLFINCNQSC